MTEPGAATPMDLEHGTSAPARSVMPPYLVLPDFFDEKTVADLLVFTLAKELAFEPTKVGRFGEGKFALDERVSIATRELGPFRPILESKILGLVPHLMATLRTSPAENPKLELQLVAHNEGAFYIRHLDTHTTRDRGRIRVLSGIYYFHSLPKAFTGGSLRLYAFGDTEGENFIDIEPRHNSLLVFPSWAPHEVRPVSCPSGHFSDSRFAINCWVYRGKSDTVE